MIEGDPWAEEEAAETARRDVDLEMAEAGAFADAAHARRLGGQCQHASAVAYLSPPCYPEQRGLRPGQLACTEHTGGCTAVWDSDEEWYVAMYPQG